MEPQSLSAVSTSLAEQIRRKTLESSQDIPGSRHVRLRQIGSSDSYGDRESKTIIAEHLTMFVGTNRATFMRGDNTLFLKSRIRIEPMKLSQEDTQVDNRCRQRLNSIEEEFMEGLNYEDFVNYVKKFEVTTRNLKLENRIFENFLIDNEAMSTEAMDHTRTLIEKMHETNPLAPPECTDNTITVPYSTKVYSFTDGGPRISTSMRTDLLLREEESVAKKLKAYERTIRKRRRKMKVELEEAMVRQEEVAETIKYFLNTVTIKNEDTAIQRIPAEKFIWFMKEWLNNARIIGEKLRMRNCSLKNQFRKLKEVHEQKMFIGENVRETDVDKLIIQGEQLKKTLDNMYLYLIDLKNMTGRAHMDCVFYKNYLQDLLTVLKTFKALCEDTAKSIEKYNSEYEESKKKLAKDERVYKQICDIVNHFKVPEVMDYIRLKAYLQNLKKQMKVIERKLNIMDIMMKTHTTLMSQLTKSKPNPSWFKRNVLDTSVDFDLQKYEIPEADGHRIQLEFNLYDCLKNK